MRASTFFNMAAVVGLAWAACVPAAAQSVNLTPLRVVLGDRDTGAEVTVFNGGASPETYRIDLAEKRMTETGGIETFSEGNPKPAGWRSAADMIRFSPRQVTLAPGQSQAVRIAVRIPPGTPTGEYRSHFTVSSVPKDTGQTIEQAAGDRNRNEVRVTLSPVYGIAIPVIVRVGAVSAKAQLVNPHFVKNDKGGRDLLVEIHRTGDASVYGDLVIGGRGVSPDKTAGRVRGIAVYPEISVRVARIPVDGAVKSPGAMVRYVADSTDPDSPVLAEVPVPAS